MCTILKTGTKGYNNSVYTIQDVSKMHLQMIEEGLHLLRENLLKSENLERHKLVILLDELNKSFKNIEL